MKDSLKYFFLNYANLHLGRGPHPLHSLFKGFKADSHISIKNSFFRIDNIILCMEKYSSYSYSEAKDALEEGDNIKTEHIRLACEAIFGYGIIDPGKDCKDCFIGIMTSIPINFMKNPTINPDKKLTCYECTQAVFRQILTEISKGREYAEMLEWYPALTFLFLNSDLPLRRVFLISDNTNPKIPFRDSIIESYVLNFDNLNFGFNRLLIGIAGCTLAEYLAKNDRRKLKRCPYCNKYFLATDIRRKTRCYSAKCEKQYQKQKKRKQRELEPEIYS